MIRLEHRGSDIGWICAHPAGYGNAVIGGKHHELRLVQHRLRAAQDQAELQRQRAEIAQRIEAARTGSSEQRESLANTPMVFDYRSGRAVRGFDPGAPLTSSLDLLAASAQATLAFVFGAIAVLGPPALVLLIALLAWRWLRPRIRPAKPAKTAAAATASD